MARRDVVVVAEAAAAAGDGGSGSAVMQRDGVGVRSLVAQARQPIVVRATALVAYFETLDLPPRHLLQHR